MFFKNLTLFRFSPETAGKLKKLPEKLEEHRLRPCGPLEMNTKGWVSPYGLFEPELLHEHGRFVMIALGSDDKLLPTATVNQMLAKRVAAIEEIRNRPLGAREKRKVKEDILLELMPRALTRPSRLAAYIDLEDGWLVVDTSSRTQAESLVTQMRETLGTFPAVQAEGEESPRALMTEWIFEGQLPEGFEIGDEIELRDPADRGAVVKCRRQDLASEEIREHLKSGKQVTQLALVYRERLGFVIDDMLTLRKFKLLDLAVESLEGSDRETARAELDARFALQVLEIRALLGVLEKTFSIHRPAGR